MATRKNARPKQKQTPKPEQNQKQTIPGDVLDVLIDALAGALVEDFERNKVLDNCMHIATIAPALGRGPSDASD